ncbi:MAG: radical SAM protein [Spirochaetales bacterium]|nr:radical SAM protein [Spirochaetales bacterium]
MLPVSDIIERVQSGQLPGQEPRYSQAAPVVVWNVNRACNMTCPHCYASARKNPAQDGPSTEMAKAVIENLARAQIKVLIFSGGEPLLRPDLLELMQSARGRGVQCHLSTNGTLLSAAIAEKLKDTGVTYAGISLDGSAVFNDRYRGLDGGYDRALAAFGHLKECGIRTGLRFTLSSRNAHEALDLYELAVEQGIDRFYVSHLVDGGRGKAFARYDLSGQDTRALMLHLFERALLGFKRGEKTRLVSGGNDADGVFLIPFLRQNLGEEAARRGLHLLGLRGGNSAGEKMINIDSQGQVHPDQFWQSAVMGNVYEQELNDILVQHPYLWLKKREEYLQGRCRSCLYLSLCRGSHRERALARTGDMFASDPACYLNDQEIGNQESIAC